MNSVYRYIHTRFETHWI